MMKVRIFWVVIFILLTSQLNAAWHDCVFDHLSTDDGLSHGSVSAMLKDGRGFMWFATWDGINRYDGNEFKTFKPSDATAESGSSNRIEKCWEDLHGNIWVLTYDAKTFRLNRKSEQFEPLPAVSDSLTNNAVVGVFPMNSGDVWIATNKKGVFRIVTDTLSNQFKTISINGNLPEALIGKHVYGVSPDHFGNVWISSNKGMHCLAYDENSDVYYPKESKSLSRLLFQENRITAFYASSACCYFGTDNGRLITYRPETDAAELLEVSEHAVSSIDGSSGSEIYIGTRGSGVFVYDEKEAMLTSQYQFAEMKVVLKMFADSQRRLWVETNTAGISKIDLNTGIHRRYTQELAVHPDVRATAQCGIMEDAQSVVWMTLKGGGFGYYDEASDELLYFYNRPNEPQSKISNFVNCFYKDPDGVLWLSTYFKGIDKITFVDQRFRLIQPESKSNFSIANEVRALLEDRSGKLWLASKNQELFLFDRDFKLLKRINTLNNQAIGRIYALFEDSRGIIYLGTKGNGLFQLTPKGELEFDVVHYTHESNKAFSISGNNIYSITEDLQNRIWIGTYGGGLNLKEGSKFHHPGNGLYHIDDEKAKRVRHVVCDHNGSLWAGTTGGMLVLKETRKQPFNFSFYNSSNTTGLHSNDLFWIYPDNNGQVWLSSLGGGLAMVKYNINTADSMAFRVWTKNDGLPSDMLFTIVPDRNGTLWMATENGIASFHPETSLFETYSQNDGLTSSGFSEGAVTVRSDGSICMGANNGVYVFQPDSFKREPKKVALYLTGLHLFGEEQAPGDGSVLEQALIETSAIRLKHNQNVFGIRWAGLDYKLNGQLQYVYQLEGYDTEWRKANTVNQADYAQVPYGEYLFRVALSNPELKQLSKPATLSITIAPPIWKTTWAYAFYLLVVIVLAELSRRIITTIIHLRNKVIIEKEIANARVSFFTNISHELRTPLTLILGPSKELKRNEQLSRKGKVYAELIEQNAQRLLRLVNQLLDLRKIQSKKMHLVLHDVNLVELAGRVSKNFEELAASKQIQLTLEVPEKPVMAMLDEEKIDTVLFNLLSNAFKFTPKGGHVKIIVNDSKQNKTGPEIKVLDNGRGITSTQIKSLFTLFSSHDARHAEPGSGIGLSLSKEIMQLHRGDLYYEPGPGGGACFVASFADNLQRQTGTEDKAGKQEERKIHEEKETLPRPASVSASLPMILIVEDDDDLRRFLGLQLEAAYRVILAENGREGLQRAASEQPDLIVSDVMMPEMNGFELLEALKNNFETSHIPVVLLSARASVESKIEGLKYGADAYLTKPFNSMQLHAQIENLLNQRKQLRQSFSGVQQDGFLSEGQLQLTERDAAFLTRCREVIEEHLADPGFKMETLYIELGMGRSKFYEKMKGLTGLSPIDFVKEYRLVKARKLIETGAYNVSETAFLTGFSDAGYFSKCFKERYQLSPSQLMKA